MKSWLLVALLLSDGLPGWHWLTQVREHNAAQAQGQAALASGRPTEAVYYYQQAVALAGQVLAQDLIVVAGCGISWV